MTPIVLPPKMRASLRKTQRLWISYRDEVCKAQAGTQLGTSLCMIQTTRERIADIESFYTISR